MNMRKTGLLLTGGLAVMLVVFIVAYGILLATETMPVHIEIKEPPTADQQHGNIALPSVIESVDPEYLLTNIYSATDSQAPSFAFVDTDGSGNTVSSVGVFDGSVATPVITFGDTPTRITLNDVTVSGADAIPAAGEVRVVGGSIAIVGTISSGGYVDGGGSVGNADNTALIRVGNLAVSNTGWSSIIYAGSINADAAGGRVEVAIGDSVLITGGNTLITGLNGGGDICRASVVVGRTIVDPNADGQLVWSEFGGRAAETRVSGLLGFTVPFPENAAVVASLNIDTGANSGGVIARDAVGNLDTDTDGTADRLATLPLPRTNADPHDGAVLLPLQVGTRVELPAYSETPAIREIQLVIDLPDVSAIQCAAVTNARWEQPTLGTITTRNTYCGGVPLGGVAGQALTKLSDDDCHVGWVTVRDVPDGGADDEVLTWDGAFSTYAWEPVPDQSGGG